MVDLHKCGRAMSAGLFETGGPRQPPAKLDSLVQIRARPIQDLACSDGRFVREASVVREDADEGVEEPELSREGGLCISCTAAHHTGHRSRLTTMRGVDVSSSSTTKRWIARDKDVSSMALVMCEESGCTVMLL